MPIRHTSRTRFATCSASHPARSSDKFAKQWGFWRRAGRPSLFYKTRKSRDATLRRMTNRGWRIGTASVVHWVLGAVWYSAFSGVFDRWIGSERLRDLETRSEAGAFSFAF